MKKLLVVLILLLAMNAGAQWVPTVGVNGGAVLSFTVSGTNIYAGTVNGGVFLSTNGGANWTAVNSGLTNPNVNALTVMGTNIFAGTYGGGVFMSANNGANWSAAGLTGQYVQTFATMGNVLYAGTNNSGVFLSSDNGSTWLPAGLTTVYVNTLAVLGTNIFAGTNNGIFLSTNGGANWTSIISGLTNQQVLALTVSGSNIFAGTNNGAFLSTNNGSLWIPVWLSGLSVYSFIVSGNALFAGTNDGVYLSTNNGTYWFTKNQGFSPVPLVYKLSISDNYILAGTATQSVWRRSYTEIIGIENISTEMPSKYSLGQNYPNPFNPMCNVQFSMYNAGNVKIVVYDILGSKVQTLVNERLQPGMYEVKFDGSMLNSGVYFYKLVTGNFTETKKMLLLK